jgi:transposase, IS30 family
VGQVREVFWAAVRAGMSPAPAAVVAGVSENAGREWITQAGYVLRTPVLAVQQLDAVGPSLSFTERCRLEQLLESRSSPAGAARLLGRHPATISRETGGVPPGVGIALGWVKMR